MAAKKKKAAAGKGGDLLISKSRTKASVKKCNVSGDFYGAFDAAARNLLKIAEERALANKRKTLRPQDL
jgi:histone H3/H4